MSFHPEVSIDSFSIKSESNHQFINQSITAWRNITITPQSNTPTPTPPNQLTWNGKEEAISDRLDQSPLEEDTLGQEVIVVEGNGPMVVDDEGCPLLRNVLEPHHLVPVPDPPVGVPHDGDRMATSVPVVSCSNGLLDQLQLVPVLVQVDEADGTVAQEEDHNGQEEGHLWGQDSWGWSVGQLLVETTHNDRVEEPNEPFEHLDVDVGFKR